MPTAELAATHRVVELNKWKRTSPANMTTPLLHPMVIFGRAAQFNRRLWRNYTGVIHTCTTLMAPQRSLTTLTARSETLGKQM
jgi:hypothetical protein